MPICCSVNMEIKYNEAKIDESDTLGCLEVFNFFLSLKVKYWITMNDPLSVCMGYINKDEPPSRPRKPDYRGFLTAARHLLLAHAHVYRLYDKKYRASQNGLSSAMYTYMHILSEMKTTSVETEPIFFLLRDSVHGNQYSPLPP